MSGMHTVLINPPADVQSAVGAVTQACAAWQPTAVPDLPPSRTAAHMQAPASPSEAQVCAFIKDPDAGTWTGFDMALGLVLLVVAFGWAFRLQRLPGLVGRLVGRAYRAIRRGAAA